MLSHLVDKSLVIVEEQSGETRYRMLETISEYALEKLSASGEEEHVRNRHLDFFLQLAEKAELQTEGANQVPWMNRLEWEDGNIRGALGWTLESKISEVGSARVEAGVRLAGALWEFWFWHAHLSEGRKWLLQALVGGKDSSPSITIRAKVLLGVGHITNYLGSYAS